MGFNLAMFLSVAVVSSVILIIVIASMVYAQKSKQAEIDKLKYQKANIRAEVEDAVKEKFANHASRIEVLEAIVTDKHYDLGEKITRLK